MKASWENCDHARVHFVRYRVANDSEHLRTQCAHCDVVLARGFQKNCVSPNVWMMLPVVTSAQNQERKDALRAKIHTLRLFDER